MYLRTQSLFSWVGLAIAILALPASGQSPASKDSASNPSSYLSPETGIAFEYPSSWSIMTPTEVTQKTKGLMDTKDALVFVVNDRDPDRNVNIKSFAVPVESLTTAAARELEGVMDKEFPRQFTGFKKISARVITVAGVSALEYVMDTTRVDKLMRLKSVLLVKARKDYVLTFTAPREDFQRADDTCFSIILKSFSLK